MDSTAEVKTIRDLAASLGVSVMTVHRAIAGKPDISPKTRERVLAEIERLGWRPNMAARGLRQGKTFTLGILVSNVAASFLPEVLQGFNQTAETAGCHTFVSVHEHQPERAIRHLKTLQSKGVDGIILYPTQSGAEAEVVSNVARSIPIVLVMREIEGLVLPAVLVDDVAAGRLAGEHLLGLGHRSIGFVGYADSVFSQQRREGFEAALAIQGVAMRPEWIIPDLEAQGDGARAARRILTASDRPTALFCASDRLAARAIQAATGLGLRIPDDLSIMGCNADPWGDLLTPPLSTVDQCRSQVGSRAALCILDPEYRTLEAQCLTVAPTLVPRGSTGPFPC